MNTDASLVCNMGVFTPTQRENHSRVTRQLIQALQSVQEVEHGYEFLFPNETASISKIAEFISNERLCCPFLRFTFFVNSVSEPVSLSLTGPVGTQDFLRAEFDGAFS